jgi:hypothetical protein
MQSKNNYQWLAQMFAAVGAIISLSLVAYDMKQSLPWSTPTGHEDSVMEMI